jgi:WD40 repeat protein
MKMTYQVNDIEWSPYTSTIFGSVCDDGRVEIWDLARGTIDPIITMKTDEPGKANVARKSIKFSRSSQVVACGDSDFDIDVFRLYNLKHVEVNLII